jgi:hypothetical protein
MLLLTDWVSGLFGIRISRSSTRKPASNRHLMVYDSSSPESSSRRPALSSISLAAMIVSLPLWVQDYIRRNPTGSTA